MSFIRQLAIGCRRLILPAALAFAVLVIFAPVLFTRRDVLPSREKSDLAILFVPLRAFAAEQLRAGHLPQWNPHIFCGSPFLGNFQSALLYPLTWLHVVFPLAPAINWTIALEFFLAAWFTSLCCRYRGVGIPGSFLGGLAYALSGAFFLRLYAGHLATVGTMTWAPLVLLAIDHILDKTSIAWSLIGGLAVALMLLAGSPPNVYNTALIFALYAAIRFSRVPRKLRVAALLILLALFAFGLSAAQVLPGLRVGQEAVRSAGTTYDFASDGPLPPENILTLYSARIWGDVIDHPYTGRSYLWESNLFIGMATTILAATGIVLAPPRHKWPLVTCAAVAFILALGNYSHVGSFNLHRFLFDHFPMYNRFRTTGRFGYLVTLCLAILAAMGAELLPRPNRKSTWIGIASLAIALAMAITVSIVRRQSAATTISQTLIASGIAAAVGLLILLNRKSRICALAIVAVATVELIVFAVHFRIVSDVNLPDPPLWADAIIHLAPNQRVLHNTFEFASIGMTKSYNDIYGYDPVILRRYAELLAQSQGENPDNVDYAPNLEHPFPLLVFMRCRYVLVNSNHQYQVFTNPHPPMPHLQLIDSYRVIPDRHDNIAAVMSDVYDLSTHVILESEPSPRPVPGATSPGSAEVIAQTTDTMEIRASVTRSMLLVMSDSYSQDWRATPIEPSPQATYTIMPANHAFMAIPLAAGTHHLRLTYRPTSWILGVCITLVSLAAWISAMATVAILKFTAAPASATLSAASAARIAAG
jgi:hypothetical protein